jgi:arginine/ornithine transport system permease protein
MQDWLTELFANNDIFTFQTISHYGEGFVVTVQLVFLSLLIGLVIAFPLALIRASNHPIWSRAVWIYTYVFRGTPLLIQLYIIYYGVAQIEGIQQTFWWAIFKEAFYPALFAFTLNTAAYTTEILRGAILTTTKGELEAAKAYGMSWWQQMRIVVLPSAFRRALPAYANEVIFMLHASAIASTVTIVDLTGAAYNIYARHYAPFEAFIFVALIYLCITFTLIFAFKKLEHKMLAHLRPL